MLPVKLFTTFKLLLGKGRAFNLQEPNVQNVSKAFLKPFEELARIFHKIAFTPFPSENTYNKDNTNPTFNPQHSTFNNEQSELVQDIDNFETQFGIDKNNRATIQERAKNVEAQFGLVGGQSFTYLQQNLRNAGIDVRVVENIPTKDLLSNNIVQYGLIQYNMNDEDEDHKQYAMYGKSGFLMIGNGLLQIKEYNETTETEEIVNKDPVSIDKNNVESLSHLFLIEKTGGGTINLTAGQLDILIDLVLRIKPANTVALINLSMV
jgi:hypothetical protein